MMELQQQVASLELCKKLKALGVKQKSLFYWARSGIYVPGFTSEDEPSYGIIFIKNHNEQDSYQYSAFTVSELVELLPAEIGNPHLEMVKNRDGSYGIEYLCLYDGYTVAITFADACAKMLVKLIENGLVKP